MLKTKLEKYDYVIVGSGLFGSVFAYEMHKINKTCLVIDCRKHVGGNVYCEKKEGITVHKYGPHIFHTNDETIWNFVNQFAEFNHFINKPMANYYGEKYNLPFNMNTFFQMWGTETVEQARSKIEEETKPFKKTSIQSLEELALSTVGPEIYSKLIKGYTEKQWGRQCQDLPASILKRIPVRLEYDNNYFNDKYQGIPKGGYNAIIDGLLEGVEVILETDYFNHKDSLEKLGNKLVYTGKLDAYFNYQFGELEYRSLRFDEETLDTPNFQNNAIVNYTDPETKYTRIVEHKHFEFGTQPKTVITKEYPQEWSKEKQPYYPINDEKNKKLYSQYKKLADACENVIFGGRLAQYKYYDMDQVIASALSMSKKEKETIIDEN